MFWWFTMSSFPNGYSSGSTYTKDGCTVYCTTEPVDCQCQEGGSGCESSCYFTVICVKIKIPQ